MANKNVEFRILVYDKGNSLRTIQESIKLFFKNFCNPYQLNIDVTRAFTGSLYDENIYEVHLLVLYYVEKDLDIFGIVTKICKKWCQIPEENFLGWLIPPVSHFSSRNKFPSHYHVCTSGLAFGTLPKLQCFMEHYHYFHETGPAEMVTLFVNLQNYFLIYFTPNHSQSCNAKKTTFVFKVQYPSISLVIIDDTDPDSTMLFLQLDYPPVVQYQDTGSQDYKSFCTSNAIRLLGEKSYRALEFGCSCHKSACSIKEIGKSPILKLVLLNKFRCEKILQYLFQQCNKNVRFCYCGLETRKDCSEASKPVLKLFPTSLNNPIIFSNRKYFGMLDERSVFDCNYAWHTMFCSSLVVRDQILLSRSFRPQESFYESVLRMLQFYVKKNVSALIQAMYAISDLVRKDSFIVFHEALEMLHSYFCSQNLANDLPNGMCLMKRIIITPSRVMCLPPTEHFDNRVIRKFGPDYMIRFSVQEDNYSKLTFSVQPLRYKQQNQFMEMVVKSVLHKGMHIGNRCYDLLASSNSQLRDHGMWLYAKDSSGNTAVEIRQWLGDFSDILNVAQYMARMGQCFSSSEQAVQLAVDGKDEIQLLEVQQNGKIFSDGIGTISSLLAREVRVAMNMETTAPSAFQIRYKGCKGMVVEDPTLEGRKLGIRPSMRKFGGSKSNHLEIVKVSAPRKLFLNRQLITILEQLGVPKDVFMELQNLMILRLIDSLIQEKSAALTLSQYLSSSFPYHDLHASGITMIGEPFFRSLLLGILKSYVANLCSKGRIIIPPEYGRNMLGVLDETKTLKYGQVFVQYSRELHSTTSPLTILEGTIVVTKNPCMHPGDVRKLEAVNVPTLHHIKDCIVFPSCGKRPHPDEMAGSDLDGDEYVVIWHKDLIFPKENFEPMMYPSYKLQQSNHIGVTEMIDFFCNYIKCDNIGVLANAHLAWADQTSKGIFSDICLNIAKIYPYALDFVKTGKIIPRCKGEKLNQYPDFMRKGSAANSYYSPNSLGVLYRNVRHLEACVESIDTIPYVQGFDPFLNYPGWEKYKKSAESHKAEYVVRIHSILNRFGADSEAEALCGCIRGLPQNQNREEKTNVSSILRAYLFHIVKKYRDIFKNEVMNEVYNFSNIDKKKCQLQRASAWYMVTYKENAEILSFPWILSIVLVDVRKECLKLKCRLPPDMSKYILGKDSAEFNNKLKMACNFRNTVSVRQCECALIGIYVLTHWLHATSLINNGSTCESCARCLSRILKSYFSSSTSCCSAKTGNACTCSNYCSYLLFIIKMLQFYQREVKSSLGVCTDDCYGFWDSKLQALALETLTDLVVSRNLSQLGIYCDGQNKICKKRLSSEGISFCIPFNEELYWDVIQNIDKMKQYLKKNSGVQEINIEVVRNGNMTWQLRVNSVGTLFEKYYLQDMVLDKSFLQKLKKIIS